MALSLITAMSFGFIDANFTANTPLKVMQLPYIEEAIMTSRPAL
jgi:hypothetical protein